MTRLTAHHMIVAIALLVLPHEARSQSIQSGGSSERVVTLPDGSLYRGELIELVPNDHITIRLATGEVRRFEWATISDVSTPVVAPTLRFSLPPPAPPITEAQRSSPKMTTRVTIESDDNRVALFRSMGSTQVVAYSQMGAMVGNMESWKQVCRAPCGVTTDVNERYAIRGDGIVPSGHFSLPFQPTVTLHVKSGSAAQRLAGVLLLSLGVGGITTGGILLAMGPILSLAYKDIGNSYQPDSSYRVGGGVMIGLGVGMLAGGIALMVKSKTYVRFDDGEPVARSQIPSTVLTNGAPTTPRFELTPQDVRF